MTTAPPSTSMLELVRFLMARVGDDEQTLRKQRRQVALGSDGSAAPAPYAARRDVAWSADRLRAECETKRQLIGQAQHLLVLRDLPSEKPVRDAAMQMLHALADPYRDHYAYRAEWGTHVAAGR